MARFNSSPFKLTFLIDSLEEFQHNLVRDITNSPYLNNKWYKLDDNRTKKILKIIIK